MGQSVSIQLITLTNTNRTHFSLKFDLFLIKFPSLQIFKKIDSFLFIILHNIDST